MTGKKKPPIKWREYQKNLPTQDDLKRWFKGKSSKEISIAVVAGVNNLVVLDIEQFILFDLFFKRTVNELAEFTWICKTGKGYHVYFKYDGKTKNIKAEGVIEIRARRQICVAPPSIHPNGRKYEWVSDVENTEIMDISPSWYSDIEKKVHFIRKHLSWISSISPFWKEGYRHDLALYLSGYLRKSGLFFDQCRDIIKLISYLSGDDEIDERIRDVEDTYKKGMGEIAGYKNVCEILNTVAGFEEAKSILNKLTNVFEEERINTKEGEKGKSKKKVEKKEEPFEPLSIDPNIRSADQAIRKLHKYLEFKDEGYVRIFLATCASNFIEGDPLWLIMIGPPGSMKTELIRSLGEKPNELCYPLSNLTPNTFISGFKGAGDLLPKLNSKIVSIKDFGTLLSKNKDTRNEIFGQLREIYDQYYSKATGSGKLPVTYHAKITNIIAATPIIDRFQYFQVHLGERYLRVRLQTGDDDSHKERVKIGKKALSGMGGEKEMREDLKRVVHSLLKNIENLDTPMIKEEHEEEIVAMGNILAVLRTPIIKDRYGAAEYSPEPKYPTRCVKELGKLAMGLALIDIRYEINEDDLRILWRVVLDCTDKTRIRVFQSLFTQHTDENRNTIWEISHKSIKTSIAAERSRIATVTAKRRLEDLFYLGLVVREGNQNSGYEWKLNTNNPLIHQYLRLQNRYGIYMYISKDESKDEATYTSPKLQSDRVERSQREKIQELRNIIWDLDEGDGAEIECIIEEAKKRGIPKEFVEVGIKELMEKGEVYLVNEKYRVLETYDIRDTSTGTVML